MCEGYLVSDSQVWPWNIRPLFMIFLNICVVCICICARVYVHVCSVWCVHVCGVYVTVCVVCACICTVAQLSSVFLEL